ncbi:alpha/beta-type small acid-soluble spore protein [Bacillus smithii]|uniref:small, acid-soluble spore protein, alpha/beta type n=1 Tax=Bacillus smithii TaxID=1479 RepID=UPI003D24E194
MTRNNRPLVPGARKALDQLKANIAGTSRPQDAKFEAAKEAGVPLKKGYNGDLTSEQAGKIGGKIGGNMVKRLIELAEENLTKRK